MKKVKTIVILLSIFLSFNFVTAQSVTFEIGAAKHFVPKTENYEQPNLDIQIRHRILAKFEYSISYYTIQTFWPYPNHEILPWNGDPKELNIRDIYGLDLTYNLVPLLNESSKFGLGIGPTLRLRDEIGFDLCQKTSEGWVECFYYRKKMVDEGLNLEGYFNYFIWSKIGLTACVKQRIYFEGPPSFSINLGVIYKLNY